MAFTRRCTIEVLSGQVTGTLTDFPVLISKTHNDLKLVANGGYVENANGYDIRVFSDAALTSAIPFELVFYDGTAGTFIAWAKIASCAAGSQYRLGFGDAALNTNASSTSTWRSEYKGVWHGNSLNDSTSNGNTLTFGGSGSSSGAAGKISPAGAFSFNGSGWATAGDQASLDIASGVVSFSQWLKVPGVAVAFTLNKLPSAGGNGYEFLYGPGGDLTDLIARDQITGNNYQTDSSVISWNDNAWHLAHAVIANVGTPDFTLFADGAVQNTPNTITIGSLASTAEFQIAAREGANRFTGSIEETRVYEGVLTSAWIDAEYKSQSNPGAFASYTFDGPSSGGSPYFHYAQMRN